MELRELIKRAEQRLVEYKKMLEEINKDKIIFPVNDEFVTWYKSLLRENKNSEQIWLRELVKEKTYENEGLNTPFCYLFRGIDKN